MVALTVNTKSQVDVQSAVAAGADAIVAAINVCAYSVVKGGGSIAEGTAEGADATESDADEVADEVAEHESDDPKEGERKAGKTVSGGGGTGREGVGDGGASFT